MTPEQKRQLIDEIERTDWSRYDRERDAEFILKAGGDPQLRELIECSSMASSAPSTHAGRWPCWVTPSEFTQILRGRLEAAANA